MLEIILTKYLKLCHSYGKCQRIFDRIKYLIMLKSHISDDKKKSQMLQKSKLTQTMIYLSKKRLNMHIVVLIMSRNSQLCLIKITIIITIKCF